LIFHFLYCHAIEFQLVQAQLVKTDRKRQSKDAENNDKPKDVLKDKEDDGYDIGNLVYDLHEVKRFSADNERHETYCLSLNLSCYKLLFFGEPVFVRRNQSD
jgi:hypothetical protein